MTNTATIISLTFSGIASVLAILSPIVTVIINNKHQRKLKRNEKLFDLKYEKYQKFFALYADYYVTHEYKVEELSNVIIDCLLVSNEDTTRLLNLLLRKINGEVAHVGMPDEKKYTFNKCVQRMKQELNIL